MHSVLQCYKYEAPCKRKMIPLGFVKIIWRTLLISFVALVSTLFICLIHFWKIKKSVNLSVSVFFGTQTISTNNVCLNAITAHKSRTSFPRFYILVILSWIFCFFFFFVCLLTHICSLWLPKKFFGNFHFE